jgi:CDGSH-type Zn-finger protein
LLSQVDVRDRCGHSKNKPFCDGSHLAVQFEAPGAEIVVKKKD